MRDVRELSTFGRVIANEKSMGYYATDQECCRRIRNLLQFPEGEVTALDPTAGTGEALFTVTDVVNNSQVKLFTIELSHERAEVLKKKKEDGLVMEALEADFYNGVRISNNVFSFVFSNFPYMDDKEGSRCEIDGIEKVYSYLKTNGVLVTVVPRIVLNNEKFMKSFCARYNTLLMFKFPEYEYQKYKQYVVVGVKKRLGWRQADIDDFKKKIVEISELPKVYSGPLVEVPASYEKTVKVFSSKEFNADEGLQYVRKFGAIPTITNDVLSPVAYSISNYERPPVPLKNDSKYLCAVSGVGEGFNGSEETHDLHLQRGVAEIVEESKLEKNERGETVEVVSSHSQVTLTIIENNGKITELK